MQSPSVSIIVPAYNAESTLACTMASLSGQSFGDWEAIIVDDGSTDGTATLIRALAAEDQRIHGLFAGHGGVSAARNSGIRAARADWVIFLDSDDELPVDHIARMLDAARLHPHAGLMHCGWRRFSSDGTLLGEYPAQPMDDAFTDCARGCPFAIHAAMAKREAIEAVDGFDISMRICEDWDLWQRLARSGVVFAEVPDQWVDVRLRDGSLSSDSMALCRAGLSVIDRGFDSDPRIKAPLAEYLCGAPASGRDAARAHHLLWGIGNAIGRGHAIEPLLELAGSDFIEAADPHNAAATFTDGLMAGAGRLMERWDAIWPVAADGVDRFIIWLDDGETSARGGRFKWHVERHVSGLLPDATELRIGGLLVIALNLAQPIEDFHPPSGVDRLRCRIVYGNEQLGLFETPVYGPIAAARLALLVRECVQPDKLATETMEVERPAAGVVQRLLAFVRGERRERDPAPASGPIQMRIIRSRSNFADPASAIIAEEAARWPRSPVMSGDEGAAYVPPDYSSPDYWETVFSTRDPWEYENGYEAVKYHQTLDMIPEGAKFALEIACAEGHFTGLLAQRADRVLATDISPTAVERARERCASLDNVEFAQLDLARDPIAHRFDVIVCSEVLYYQPDAVALDAFADKLAQALEPCGRVILAHGNLVVDEPERTGFPWPHSFGAKGIGDRLAAHPMLQPERELWTPLYRVQMFRHSAETLGEPVVELADAAKRLPARVAGQVRWRGGHSVPVAQHWHNFPILLYHRIADDGPERLAPYRVSSALFERQLALLRANGWQGIAPRRRPRARFPCRPPSGTRPNRR